MRKMSSTTIIPPAICWSWSGSGRAALAGAVDVGVDRLADQHEAHPEEHPRKRAPRMWPIFHSSPRSRRRLGSSTDHQTSTPIAMKERAGARARADGAPPPRRRSRSASCRAPARRRAARPAAAAACGRRPAAAVSAPAARARRGGGRRPAPGCAARPASAAPPCRRSAGAGACGREAVVAEVVDRAEQPGDPERHRAVPGDDLRNAGRRPRAGAGCAGRAGRALPGRRARRRWPCPKCAAQNTARPSRTSADDHRDDDQHVDQEAERLRLGAQRVEHATR